MPEMHPRALLIAFVAAAAMPAGAQDVRDALEAGDLICEFRDGFRRSLIAELADVPRASDLLIIYEAVKTDSAQALSSAAPGRKLVRVRTTDKAVHLIQAVGSSVRATTLTGCERTKWRRGYETCVRFSARHAWHFDTLAHLDPDKSLERQPSGASTGSCEPWHID